jgi:Tfp pilus assembly PilM family ATPase
MASPKRIGFYWGEEKLTLVEFEKNAPHQVVSLPFNLKASTPSPFSSNLTGEIQITAIFQQMLQDNKITGGTFYVSLPMKEIILRSFFIPFVKMDDIHNTIKFEAKKYLPIDIQGLKYVFYTVPYTENQVKRLQVIFFAVRTETLDRYERIFKQVNAAVAYCEPCVVSLSKVLLFKKEITPTDHLAFLILDKNVGRICFIDRGIPQFIRDFSVNVQPLSAETQDPLATLNLKIVNEVANSFDFYARQFSGDRLEQILVSGEDFGQDLFNALETELKLKIRRVPPLVTIGQNNDLDTIYAMGSCVVPPLPSLTGFDFIKDKDAKRSAAGDLIDMISSYKEILFVLLICAISLVGVYILFQVQLKVTQQQYDQLSAKEGAYANLTADSIQTEIQANTDKLTTYKNIRMKSDMVLILLRVASHLPQGAKLKDLSVIYNPTDPNDAHVAIEMNGDVFKEDSNEEVKVVNQIFSDLKNDKVLSQFIKDVTVTLNLEELDGRQDTGFSIHCT